MSIRLRNSSPVLLDARREAHVPDPVKRGAACGYGVVGTNLRRITYAQALVYIKPTWCTWCFPGGVS